MTGIANQQQHIRSRLDPDGIQARPFPDRHILGLNRQPPALRHRIARIDHQIHNHLLDLSGIRLDRAGRGVEFRTEFDDIFTDETPQHAVHIGDQRIEIQHFRRDKLTAAERQQLTSQPGCPVCRFLNLLHIFPHSIGGSQPAKQQLAVPSNHGQEVIEVVRDPAGQSPDGFHFLSLAQLGFGFPKHPFRSSPLTELADLEADVFHHSQQLVIGLPDLPAEEFDDTLDLTPDEYRKPERPVETSLLCLDPTRKIRIQRHVCHPGRLAAGPNTPGQAFFPKKYLLPDDHRKRIGLHR